MNDLQFVCAQHIHESFKTDLATFKAHTRNHRTWRLAENDVLLIGECAHCPSTLGFELPA